MKLPKSLREISGLAAHGGYLFAIADESGQVYRIHYDEARVKKWLSFGQPPLAGDFEGLTVIDKALYAVTSKGKLYKSADVENGQAHEYQRFDSGVGKQCEIEGLTAIASQNLLLLLCKTPLKKTLRGKLHLFAWSTVSQSRVPEADIQVSFADFPSDGGEKPGKSLQLFPSAVGRVGQNELWVLAARSKTLLKLRLDGQPVSLAKLPDRKRHPQAEGFIFSQGNVYIANEAGKKAKRGTLLEYPGRI